MKKIFKRERKAFCSNFPEGNARIGMRCRIWQSPRAASRGRHRPSQSRCDALCTAFRAVELSEQGGSESTFYTQDSLSHSKYFPNANHTMSSPRTCFKGKKAEESVIILNIQCLFIVCRMVLYFMNSPRSVSRLWRSQPARVLSRSYETALTQIIRNGSSRNTWCRASLCGGAVQRSLPEPMVFVPSRPFTSAGPRALLRLGRSIFIRKPSCLLWTSCCIL